MEIRYVAKARDGQSKGEWVRRTGMLWIGKVSRLDPTRSEKMGIVDRS